MTRRRTSPLVRPLPSINGINPSYLWLPAGDWPSLFAFLCQRFPHLAADGIARRLTQGDIVDDQGQAFGLDSPYRPHQRIWYHRQVPDEPELPFAERILFHNERIVIADKPHFMAATPAGRHLQNTLLTRLRKRLNNPELSPAHRLDRETAGLMLFTTQPQWRGPYQQLFQDRQVDKEYLAVANYQHHDWPLDYACRLEKQPNSFCMQVVAGEANSHCQIQLLERQQDWGLYLLRPSTGKQHQLRVQMASLGMGLKNDPWYPILQDERPDDWQRPLQLQAKTLAFTDPIDGQEHRFHSQQLLQWPPLD